MYELWNDPRNFETTSIILHLALHTTCIMREQRVWWFLKLVSVNSHISTLFCLPDNWKVIPVPEFQNYFYWILAYIWLCLFALSLWYILILKKKKTKTNWVFFLKSNLNYIQLNPSLYMQLGCPRGFESRMSYMLSERAHLNMCSFFVYQVSKRQ